MNCTCPKCGSSNIKIDDVGDLSDVRLTCLDCDFTKCYDGIDS